MGSLLLGSNPKSWGPPAHKYTGGCANASARASSSQQDALKLPQGWERSPHLLDKKQVFLAWIMPSLILCGGLLQWFLYPISSLDFPWLRYPCVHLMTSFFLTFSPFLLCSLLLSPFYPGKAAAFPSHQPSHVLVAGGTSTDSAGSGILRFAEDVPLLIDRGVKIFPPLQNKALCLPETTGCQTHRAQYQSSSQETPR